MIEDLHDLAEVAFRDEPPLRVSAARAMAEARAVRRTRRRLATAGLAVTAVAVTVVLTSLHPGGRDRLLPPATVPLPVPTRLDVADGPSAATARAYEALLRRQVELAGRQVTTVWWDTGDRVPAAERAGTLGPGVPHRVALDLDGGHGWVSITAGVRSGPVSSSDICAMHPVCSVTPLASGVQRVVGDASSTPRDFGGAPDRSSEVTLLFPDGRYVSATASSARLVQALSPDGGSGLVVDGTDAAEGPGTSPGRAIPPPLGVPQLRLLVEAAAPPVAAAPASPPGTVAAAHGGGDAGRMTDQNIDPGTGAVLSTTTQVLGPRDASGRQTLTTTLVVPGGTPTVTTTTVGP